MTKKRGLGISVEALLGSNALEKAGESPSGSEVKYLSLDQLVPNPFQPRKVFGDAAITQLADSIRQHGIIQPLAVRQIATEQYEIIAGERRFRAAKLAGLSEVPVVIHDVSDNDSAIFALIENIQREDLNAIDKAKGIQSLIQQFDLTHAECGKVLGQSRTAISNALRLLDLSDEVQAAVIAGQIDMGHARAMLAVEKKKQVTLLKEVIDKTLSVRDTEQLVRNASPRKAATKSKSSKSAHIKQLEKQLSDALQTTVILSKQTNGGGKMTLLYDDDGMLRQLIKRLGAE